MKLINTQEYEKEKARTAKLERLVKKMAGLLKDYQVPEYDYEARNLMDEVNEVALQ